MDAISALEAINAINLLSEENLRRPKTYKKRGDPFQLDDVDFRQKYRVAKNTANFIISLVYEDLKVDNRGGGIPPQLQVLAALRCWGRREVQDDCGDLHGLSQATVSRICTRVSRAIAKHAPTFIKMPSTVSEEELIMQQFQAIADFPTVNGAIDCTHIKIRKTGGDLAQYYINRKGVSTINVQAVCDPKLRFTDIVARWRGSTHDSRIFAESTLKSRFEDRQFRGRLLGDSGYPLLPYLFTPLLHPSNQKEERYNRAHIKTRNTIERCFGVWKQRFQCLLFGMTVSLPNVKTMIVALAVVHNIAISMNDFVLDDNDVPSEVAGPSSTITNANDSGLEGHALRRQSRYLLNNFIEEHF